MADIEGTAVIDQSAVYLYPKRKLVAETLEGDNGEPIEGTEA